MTQPIPGGHEDLIPHLVCDPCSDAEDKLDAAMAEMASGQKG